MGLGLPELLIIFAIILLVFGAGKLPQVMGQLGKGVNAFKEGASEAPWGTVQKASGGLHTAKASAKTAPKKAAAKKAVAKAKTVAKKATKVAAKAKPKAQSKSKQAASRRKA